MYEFMCDIWRPAKKSWKHERKLETGYWNCAWLTHIGKVTRSRVYHDWFIHVTWFTTCDMEVKKGNQKSVTYSWICAMTRSYVPWLVHMCHDSFICAMTRSYLWHASRPEKWRWKREPQACDPVMYARWLVHECDYHLHSMRARGHHVFSYMYARWLVHECAMTRSCMWYASRPARGS